MELKDCFKEDFAKWLVKSNNSKIRNLKSSNITQQDYSFNNRIINHPNFHEIEKESLKEILSILLEEPEADYFWYNHNKTLTYSLPNEDVSSSALKVDSEKVKIFLRDFKIGKILY